MAKNGAFVGSMSASPTLKAGVLYLMMEKKDKKKKKRGRPTYTQPHYQNGNGESRTASDTMSEIRAK